MIERRYHGDTEALRLCAFMPLWFVFSLLFMQNPVPSPRVIVGLIDDQQLVVNDARFTGFIETRDGGQTVLLYRQKAFHGEMNVDAIARIDIDYKRGRPFPLTITLRNGQKLEAQSDRRQFLALSGKTENGTIRIRHPDPIASPPDARTKQRNRRKDLTIRYLEFVSTPQ